MNCPLSTIGLRGVLSTLTALLSLPIMRAGTGATIWWSGKQDVAMGLGPGMNINYFDLNGDGTDDFGFRNYEGTLSLVPVSGNRGVADTVWQPGHLNYSPLSAGTLIEATLPGAYSWASHESFLASYRGGCPWSGVGYGILGVSFDIAGETHYGWIRMSSVASRTFVVHDWAYELRPGAPIKAGAMPGLTAAPQVVRSGYLRLKWRREAGKSYHVEGTTHLDSPAWTLVFVFGVWITPTEMAVDVRMEGAAQFFRVVEAD